MELQEQEEEEENTKLPSGDNSQCPPKQVYHQSAIYGPEGRSKQIYAQN